MEFQIRPVREGDAESIVQLLNPIILAGNLTIMDKPITISDQINFIKMLPGRGVYHVAMAKEGGEVLGLQDVLPTLPENPAFHHVGEISTFVSLSVQRNGIGQALSRITFEASKKQDFKKLRAMIRADNAQAIAFYQKIGFEIIGTARKQAHVGGRFIDEVLAERFLE